MHRQIKAIIVGGIGFFCFLPSAISPSCSLAFACGCSKISSVKANMYTLQTAVETFFADEGRFPVSLQELKRVALQQGYWIDFRNPMGKSLQENVADPIEETLINEAYLNTYNRKTLKRHNTEIVFGIPSEKAKKETFGEEEGNVILNLHPKGYSIYGRGYDGLIFFDRGEVFSLSYEGH